MPEIKGFESLVEIDKFETKENLVKSIKILITANINQTFQF